MKTANHLYVGLTAIAGRLDVNERRARHLVDLGVIRTIYVGRRRATTETMIEEDIATLESMKTLPRVTADVAA